MVSLFEIPRDPSPYYYPFRSLGNPRVPIGIMHPFLERRASYFSLALQVHTSRAFSMFGISLLPEPHPKMQSCSCE